jgi:Xaa-Pro aminopeptidase
MTHIIYHEFSLEEYDLRYRKAKILMKRIGADGLLVTDERNVRYFSGFTPRTKNRPVLFFLPLKGDPILLVSKELGVEDAKRISFVQRIDSYDLPLSHEAILATIKEAGLASSVIGIEWDDTVFGGFRPSIQYGVFEKLRQSLPKATFINSSELLWELRMVKTRAEVDCIRKACEITTKALDFTFQSIKSEMTERDVAQFLVTAMMKEGADYPSLGRPGPCGFILMDASRPLHNPHYPTEKKLKMGDLVHIDLGAVYKGYHTDFTRSAVLGPPTKRQKQIWKTLKERVQRSISRIKSGMKLGEIKVHWHGVGLDYVEAPFGGLLNRGIHRGLLARPGMVLCVEDLVFSKAGETFAFEEVVYIKKKGIEILSTANSDLRVI